MLSEFFAFDPRFVGGVHVAYGDSDGDGRAEIITVPGFGGGSRVAHEFRVAGGAAQLVEGEAIRLRDRRVADSRHGPWQAAPATLTR